MRKTRRQVINSGLLPATSQSLADQLFEAGQKYAGLENKVEDALLTSCGIDPYGGNWPFEDITHDWYDSSFEFKEIHGDWCPTLEQMQGCFALGFKCAWLCYDDGSERICGPTKIGDRRKK